MEVAGTTPKVQLTAPLTAVWSRPPVTAFFPWAGSSHLISAYVQPVGTMFLLVYRQLVTGNQVPSPEVWHGNLVMTCQSQGEALVETAELLLFWPKDWGEEWYLWRLWIKLEHQPSFSHRVRLVVTPSLKVVTPFVIVVTPFVIVVTSPPWKLGRADYPGQE